jgi:hypothetical protein
MALFRVSCRAVLSSFISLLICGSIHAIAAQKPIPVPQDSTVILRFTDETYSNGDAVVGFYSSKEDQLNHNPVLEIMQKEESYPDSSRTSGYTHYAETVVAAHGHFQDGANLRNEKLSTEDIEVFNRAKAALKSGDQQLQITLDKDGLIVRDSDKKIHFTIKPKSPEQSVQKASADLNATVKEMNRKMAEINRQLVDAQKQMALMSRALNDAEMQGYNGSARKVVPASATDGSQGQETAAPASARGADTANTDDLSDYYQ